MFDPEVRALAMWCRSINSVFYHSIFFSRQSQQPTI